MSSIWSRRSFLSAGAGLAGLGWTYAPAGADPGSRHAKVALRGGRLRGRKRAGVNQFLGIPYGADTRLMRFRAARPAEPWQGVRDALSYGPACPQANGGETQDETCLVLNVWAPSLERSVRRPVLVYIHGGGYASGSGSSPLYDGSRLAARGGVVVITLNHRLNVFGHLYLGRLLPEAFATSGNAGLLDLVLALEWVRDNVEAFGGDPSSVTLFGQSGGGAKIACLMAMPAAEGLFHRVWTMSGQQVTVQGPRGATARAKAVLDHLGVPPEGLAALPAKQVLAALAAKDPSIAGSRIYWGPVLDGVSLAVHPFWPEAPSQSARIPMVMGNTREETGSLIARTDPSIFELTWDTLPERLERDMVSDIDVHAAVKLFRETYPELSPAQVFLRATTAGRSWRAQLIQAEARARQSAPTWVYQLDYPSRSEGGRYGAYHMLDIPLVFQTTAVDQADTGDDASARTVSEAMGDALLRFARTGDPAGGALGKWPQYDLERRNTMVFDAFSRVESNPRRAEREFFARVPYIQPGTY